MKFTVVIPARYASQRLPGKPLVDLDGQTMVERVYRRAGLSKADRVIVATDNEEIENVVKGFGGEVCMTREDHASGTDRLAEVTDIYDMNDDDIVVNVQGDEPLIPPEVINQVAKNLSENTQASVATGIAIYWGRSKKTYPHFLKTTNTCRNTWVFTPIGCRYSASFQNGKQFRLKILKSLSN